MIDLNFRPKVEWRASAIPKKDGSLRYLLIPGDELKRAQHDILDELYHRKEMRVHFCATGFIPFKSTMTSALQHDRNSPLIIHLDVHNFFPTFPVKTVLKALEDRGLSKAMVDYVEDFAVFHGKKRDQLPQGAPTSPYLTNIGMFEVDKYLRNYAASMGYKYTRYADDLTFSVLEGDKQEEAIDNRKVFIKVVAQILENELGLTLSWKKTNCCFLNSPRVPRRMLGITISKDGLGYNAPQGMRKNTRAAVNNLYKKLQAGVPKEDLWPEYWQVIGRTGYCNYVRSRSDMIVANFDPTINREQFEYIRKAFNYADRPR